MSIGTIGSSLGGPITRAQIIERAQDWVANDVGYYAVTTEGWQDSTVGGPYRMDCSGMSSMAWGLASDPDTHALVNSSIDTIIPTSQLQEGDLLDDPADHVVIFYKWINQSAGTFDYYYEGSTNHPAILGTDGTFKTGADLDGHPVADYEALRYNNLVGSASTAVAGGELGDVTGDGWPDILSTTSTGTLSLYRNSAQAAPNTFNVAPVQIGSGWTNGYSVAAVGDLWDWGLSGILATAPGGALDYYPNSGQGGANTFTIAPTQVGTGFTGYTVIGLADLFGSGTGHPGLLALDPSGDLDYYPNSGGTGAVGTANATFGSAITVGTGFSGYTVDLADMDGDGRPDLLAVAPGGNLEYFPNTGNSGGSGSSDPVYASDTVVGTGFNTMQAVDTADISGAAGADLVVVNSSGTMLLFANQGGTGAANSSDPMFTGSGTQIGEGWTGLSVN